MAGFDGNEAGVTPMAHTLPEEAAAVKVHTITLADGRTFDLRAGDVFEVEYTYKGAASPAHFGTATVEKIAPYPYNNKGLFLAVVRADCKPLPKGFTFWIEDDGTYFDKVFPQIQMAQRNFSDGSSKHIGDLRIVSLQQVVE